MPAERVQDIINLIGADLSRKYYRPEISLPFGSIGTEEEPLTFEEFEKRIVSPLRRDTSSDAQSRLQRYEERKSAFQDILKRAPMGYEQAKALFNLLTSSPEQVLVGYEVKVKKGLTGKKKKKKPIYETVTIGPSAIEKYLPEVLKPSPEVLGAIEKKVLKPIAEQVKEKIESVKIPTDVSVEKPVYLEGYKGETIYDIAQKGAQKRKEELERAVGDIQSFLQQFMGEETARGLAAYINVPLFTEVGEVIHKLTGGFYNMQDFFNQLRELSEESSNFVKRLNETLETILGVKNALYSALQEVQGGA